MAKLSEEAQAAQDLGARKSCPGCMIEHKIPTNINGAALHKMPSGAPYECHADSDSWAGVPEFESQGGGGS